MEYTKITKILDAFRDSILKKDIKIDKTRNFEKSLASKLDKYEQILIEYYELTTLEELSEFDAKRLDRILELAENDEYLSFLFNEVDEITFQKLGFYENNDLEYWKDQKAKTEEFLINSENNLNSDCDLLPMQSFTRYQDIKKEYYELTTLEDLSEFNAERLDRILELAENDECLSSLLNEVDEMTFQELDFYEPKSLERVKQQKEKAKQSIEKLSEQDKSKNHLFLNQKNKKHKDKGFAQNHFFATLCLLAVSIPIVSCLASNFLIQQFITNDKEANVVKLSSDDLITESNTNSLVSFDEVLAVIGHNISAYASSISIEYPSSIESNIYRSFPEKSAYARQVATINSLASFTPITGDGNIPPTLIDDEPDKFMYRIGRNPNNLSTENKNWSNYYDNLRAFYAAKDLLTIIPTVTEKVRDVRFFCGLSQGVPTTIVQTSQKQIPFIHWKSAYFEDSGYGSQVRCKTVSNRFQELYDAEFLNYLTIEQVNGYAVVCAAKEIGSDCIKPLFTIPPDVDSKQVLFDISNNLVKVTEKNREEKSELAQELIHRHIKIEDIINFDANGDLNLNDTYKVSVLKYLNVNQYLSKVIALGDNTDIAIYL